MLLASILLERRLPCNDDDTRGEVNARDPAGPACDAALFVSIAFSFRNERVPRVPLDRWRLDVAKDVERVVDVRIKSRGHLVNHQLSQLCLGC